MTSEDVRGFWGSLKDRSVTLSDYLVEGRAIGFAAGDRGGIVMRLPDGGELEVSGRAHDQLAGALGVPKKYYDRCLSAGKVDLLAANLSTWAREDESFAGATKLVRAVGGRCRAVLSDRYRPIDSWDVASTCLEQFGRERAEVLRSCVDDDRLNLTAIRSDVSRTFRDGRGRERTVHPGVRVTNDETGGGACVVEPFLFDSYCTNGHVFGKQSIGEATIRFVHVGGRETLRRILLSEESRRAANVAIHSTIRDVVSATFDAEKFGQLVDLVTEAARRPVDAPADAVFEVIAEKFGFTDSERDRALELFISANDRTQFGLSAALNCWDVIGGYAGGAIDSMESAAGEVASWSEEDVARLQEGARRIERERIVAARG